MTAPSSSFKEEGRGGGGGGRSSSGTLGYRRVPLRRLFRAGSVACGVQFGWALQLSLLTPYVQELGIPHAWSSLVWLCGPVSGMVVQPLVGHLSDRCASPWGRRRPFIAGGALAIALAVVTIGYSSDIGSVLGDSSTARLRPRAITVFVLGFWLLDVANNLIQGPCRALLADFTGKDPRRAHRANAYYSMFMAVGNILGFATGSYSLWFKILPFTLTTACGINCANLKSAFLLGVVILALTTCMTLTAADEAPLNVSNHVVENYGQVAFDEEESPDPSFCELLGSLRYLSQPMLLIMLVTGLMWLGWFPFLLFDTDWMGREVYKGVPSGSDAVHNYYYVGVRMGAFGLLLNSVVLGLSSLVVERVCRKWGTALVLGISNLIMSFCFWIMLLISFIVSKMQFHDPGIPPKGIVVAALGIFSLLGLPLAITYSVPYAMISTHTESLEIGQGLAMGILNLSVVIPQMIVSLLSGPWDQLLGGGNSPSLFVGSAAAFASGVIAILYLPQFTAEKSRGQP
ncbi:sucrose transport protein SUT2 [Nymphaea colorata]|nr:sucrose transport protein SUT2 [Nymphaea colorata]